MATTPGMRRRRTPEDARSEILQAAGELLAEHPSHQATVSAIMERTSLSRKSFYVYFRDRVDVISALVAPLRADADAALADWRAAAEPVAAGRRTLRRAAAVYREHGAILRALAAASEEDHDAARVWRGFIEPVIEVAALKIRAATESGASAGLDPEPVARALVAMNVASLLTLRPDTPLAEVDALVDTLSTIWERTFFLRHPT